MPRYYFHVRRGQLTVPLLWSARAHLVHEPAEVCATSRVNQAQFSVGNCRVRRQLGECRAACRCIPARP
jgi:hypothetical protein